MSSFLIAKRIISSSSSFHQHHHFHHLVLLTPLLRHSLSTQSLQQKPKELPFIAQYLISSFGFSPDRALKCSADSHLRAIKSSERPDSVVAFLKDTGLNDDQIKAVISFHPPLLGRNVDKSLQPKVRELMENGFSGDLLVQLIRYNPMSLFLKGTLSRLLFWRDFIGQGDQGLLEIIPKCTLLFTFDINKHIVPVINLLKEYELSNRDIVSLLRINSCFKRCPDSLRQTLEIIEELGILRGSRMSLSAIKAVGGISRDTLIRKLESFKAVLQDTIFGGEERKVRERGAGYSLQNSKARVKGSDSRCAGYSQSLIFVTPKLECIESKE